MKKMIKCIMIFSLFSLSFITLSANSDNISEKNIYEETLFIPANITEKEEKTYKNELGEEEKIVVQTFEKIISEKDVRSSKTTYTVVGGQEAISVEDYQKREARVNKSRETINTSGQYQDDRGTYCYAEIRYTKEAHWGANLYDMQYIYCNSSGKTLSKYTVNYGQTGLNKDGVPTTQRGTKNISTIYKTFSKNLNWQPVLGGGPYITGIAGLTQFYTQSNGWSNEWSFLVPMV